MGEGKTEEVRSVRDMIAGKHRIVLVLSCLILSLIGLCFLIQRRSRVDQFAYDNPVKPYLSPPEPVVTAIQITNIRDGETLCYPVAMLTGHLDFDPQTLPYPKDNEGFY